MTLEQAKLNGEPGDTCRFEHSLTRSVLCLADADLLYDTLRRVNIDFLIAGEKASEFLTENLKAKVAVLNNALNKDDSKTAFSSRDEHPEWFHGLETNCATKVSLPSLGKYFHALLTFKGFFFFSFISLCDVFLLATAINIHKKKNIGLTL